MYRSIAADISAQLDDGSDAPPPISDKLRAEAQDAASWVQSGSIARERDQASADLAHIRRVMSVAQGIGSHFGRLNQMGVERQQQIDTGERQFASGLDTTPGATGTRYGSFEGHARPLPRLEGNNPLPAVSGALNTVLNPISEGARYAGEHLPLSSPIGAGLGGDITGGPATEEQKKGAGQLLSFAAPAVADTASGGTLSILYGAQAAANIANSVSEYSQGNIDGKQLLTQIALTSPQLIPVLLHGGSKLAQLAQSPEGQQTLRDAVDTLKAKGSQLVTEQTGAVGKDLPGRTPEESAGATEKYQAQAAKDQANKLQKMEFHTLLEDWHALSREEPAAAAPYEAELTRRGITNPESTFREYRMQPLTPEMPDRLKTPAERSAETTAPVAGQAGAPPPSEPPPPSQEAPPVPRRAVQPAIGPEAKASAAAGSSGELPAVEAPKATQGEVWQFNPAPEELTHLHNLIDHGDWTQTPGARIGARSIVKKLLNGEAPSDKQFAMLQRVLGSKQPEAKPVIPATPKLRQAKIPIEPTGPAEIFDINSAGRGATQRKATMAARGAQPDLSSVDSSVEPMAFPKSDQGALQPALADNLTDAYVGAISAGKNGSVAQTTGRWTRALQAMVSPLQLVKTIKTSFDIGWGGRQGWRLFPRNMGEWLRMYGKQYRAFKSEKNFAEIDSATKAFPNFDRSQSAERPLAYLERGTGSPETSGEEFVSGMTKHIPGLAGSERAYVAPGNWMRQAVLDKWVNQMVRRTGKPVSDADFQLFVDHINNATLRGNTKWLGKTNGSTLASLLFSVKGQVSGPQFALDAVRAVVNGGNHFSPAARRIVAENFGAYVGMGMSTLGLIATTGWALDKNGKPSFVNVDLNDLSPTFGQINVGSFKWNYWGADQSLVRTALELARGEVQKPGLPRQGVDRRKALVNYVGGKLGPGIPKAAFDEAVRGGVTYDSGIFNKSGMHMNTPMNALIYSFNQVAPISIESSIQSWRDTGPIGAAATALAETQGLSTSTYSTDPTADQLSTARRQTMTEQLTKAGLPDIETSFKGHPEYGAYIGEKLGVPGDYGSYADLKSAWIDKWLPRYQQDFPKLDENAARRELGQVFEKQDTVMSFEKSQQKTRLDFWKAHPDLLYEAFNSGVEDLNKSEQKVLDDYLKAAASQ